MIKTHDFTPYTPLVLYAGGKNGAENLNDLREDCKLITDAYKVFNGSRILVISSESGIALDFATAEVRKLGVNYEHLEVVGPANDLAEVSLIILRCLVKNEKFLEDTQSRKLLRAFLYSSYYDGEELISAWRDQVSRVAIEVFCGSVAITYDMSFRNNKIGKTWGDRFESPLMAMN